MPQLGVGQERHGQSHLCPASCRPCTRGILRPGPGKGILKSESTGMKGREEGSIDTDGVGERCGVGVVVVVGGGGGDVGAEPAAVGHPVALVVGSAEVFARFPQGTWLGSGRRDAGARRQRHAIAAEHLSIYQSSRWMDGWMDGSIDLRQ